MLPGASGLDLPAVQSHLLAAGLARQKCPEELRAVPDFPRTASGKVQKFVLRQQLREGS
jgi:non-ribosomal peptide synthetase component E (peptide arylation enzyme)